MAKKIEVIPCLDMNQGRVVKGVKFEELRDAGDAVELAERYFHAGADEIVFLDVSASSAGGRTMDKIVMDATANITVPIDVGGGINSVEEARRIIDLGATRVSVNTAALNRPDLIDELVKEFGGDSVIVSLDVRSNRGEGEVRFEVTTHGGKRGTGIAAADWAREVEKRGAGMVMLNSIAEDGVQSGYDIPLLAEIRAAVGTYLIASGGAGKVEDFVEAAKAGADGVLAASVFHFGVVTIAEVKTALKEAGFDVSGDPA